MSGYVEKALHNFQHMQPKRPQHASHDWTTLYNGSKVQYAQSKPDSPNLDPSGTQREQSIAGNCMYYYRVVDPTMLPALNEISTQQSKPTSHTISKFDHLLDYASTYRNTFI